jgi:RNA polymerase sigma factor (sigma-70 family)
MTMATSQLDQVIQRVRQVALARDQAGLTDAQLLETYVRSREEAAFAALVRRHGPMVWGVCRRLLGSHHDAEDAFQATFLVLVRKAASIVHSEKVANWLYGVAHQTALNARGRSARRRAREQGRAMPERRYEQPDPWNDLRTLLDKELSRLPEKYRVLIVLCDLEGKSRKEAARECHLPEGTVASRLATARTMLARRLARHGLALSGSALATVLAQNVASAGMPASVASSTIKAASLFAAGHWAASGALSMKAVALTEGVLRNMLLSKLKIATAVLVLAGVLGAGASAITRQSLARETLLPPGQQAPDERKAEPPAKEKEQAGSRPGNEKEEAEKRVRNVTGSVKAVDAGKGTLTISNGDSDSTYAVAKGAEIWIDGKPAEFATLPPGPRVYATLTVEGKTVHRIDALGRHFGFITVKTVDAEKNTITFDDDKAPPEVAGKTFPLMKDAHVMVDNKPGRLAAVPPGSVLSLYLCVDQKTVCTFHASGPVFEGQYAVMVKAVDGAKNTITLDENKSPPEVAGVTFPLAKNANVTIDRRPAKLADIPPGALANLALSVDRKTILVIEAAGAMLEDVRVKAVNAAKSTITVVTPKKEEKTFVVARDPEIVIDFRPGKLDELPKGAVANLYLAADQQTIRRVEALGGGVFGVVQAVDAVKGTITVAGRTLRVAKDARFEIDFKPGGKLVEVPVGAEVTPLILSVDQETAISMHVQGAGLSGVVQAVDAAKNTITVADKTFPVALDADIEIDGKRHKLADIPRGARVDPLVLSADQKTVRLIRAVRP